MRDREGAAVAMRMISGPDEGTARHPGRIAPGRRGDDRRCPAFGPAGPGGIARGQE